MALLAIFRNHGGEIFLCRHIHEIGGRRSCLFHSHIKRSVAAERKATRRLVQLKGRNAEIEHDTVAIRFVVLSEDFLQRGKPALGQYQTAPELTGEDRTAADRMGIPVDAKYPAVRPLEQGA